MFRVVECICVTTNWTYSMDGNVYSAQSLVIKNLLYRGTALHPGHPVLDGREFAQVHLLFEACGVVLPRDKGHIRKRILAANQPWPIGALLLLLEVSVEHRRDALDLGVVAVFCGLDLLRVEACEPDGLAVVRALARD
jgi:hypothetical protein